MWLEKSTSELYWANEYASTEFSRAQTPFLSSFNYLNLRAVVEISHAAKKIQLSK